MAFCVRQRVLDHEGDSAQLKACLKLLFSEDEETPKGNCFTIMHHIVYTWVLDHEFEAIYKIFLGAFCEVVEESMMAKELKQIALTQGKREFLTRLVAHWEKAMKVVTVIRDSFDHYIRRVTSGSYTYDNLEKELCAALKRSFLGEFQLEEYELEYSLTDYPQDINMFLQAFKNFPFSKK